MNISHITTMTRVGKIVKHSTNDKKLMFEYDSAMTRELRKDERGRVYALCVDGKIVKIGGSQAKGGIDGTYSAYFSGFAKGMSERTYCVWNFITQAITNEKLVEVYCVWADTVTVSVPTMTGKVQQTIAVDFHAIENNFVNEYISIEGEHPYLNMQESGRRWVDTGLLEGYINKDGTIYGTNKPSV